ncbi:MAG: hypothetical protein R2867_33940 [Caldilineaceae bacterium]
MGGLIHVSATTNRVESLGRSKLWQHPRHQLCRANRHQRNRLIRNCKCAKRPISRDAWQRLRRNKLAIVGMIIVVTFLLLAIFADLIAPYRYDATDFTQTYQLPTLAHPFGTSPLGRICSAD